VSFMWPRSAARRVVGLEVERMTVGAIAQACGLRPIREHMTEMRIAFRAQYFDAPHAVRNVFLRGDSPRLDYIEEARPARTAFIFRVGPEKRRAAANADEGALAFLVEPRARKGTFGRRTTGHRILLR